MSTAEQVARNPVVQNGARLGFAVGGLLHLVIGVLALRLAAGDSSAHPDQTGALGTLAGTPGGGFLLVLTATGLALQGLWQGTQPFRRGAKPSDRAKAAGRAVVYLVLAAGAASYLLKGQGSSAQQSRDVTALLLSLPGGALLVGAVGLAVIVVGGYHVYKGARQRFRHDLGESPARPIVVLAVVGYVAKGIALVAAGALFVQAAFRHDPSRASGLDGALASLLRLPFGPWVVGAIGVGFAAYGVYSFARARYARV